MPKTKVAAKAKEAQKAAMKMKKGQQMKKTAPASGGMKEAKGRRNKPGTVVLREVKKYQKSTKYFPCQIIIFRKNSQNSSLSIQPIEDTDSPVIDEVYLFLFIILYFFVFQSSACYTSLHIFMLSKDLETTL